MEWAREVLADELAGRGSESIRFWSKGMLDCALSTLLRLPRPPIDTASLKWMRSSYIFIDPRSGINIGFSGCDDDD